MFSASFITKRKTLLLVVLFTKDGSRLSSFCVFAPCEGVRTKQMKIRRGYVKTHLNTKIRLSDLVRKRVSVSAGFDSIKQELHLIPPVSSVDLGFQWTQVGWNEKLHPHRPFPNEIGKP